MNSAWMGPSRSGPRGEIRKLDRRPAYKRSAARLLGASAMALMVQIYGAGLLTVPAKAQQTLELPILGSGNAVVTGFSGVRNHFGPDRKPLGPEERFIDTDGIVARIVDLSVMSREASGKYIVAPKAFDFRAKDIGQVFGIALDDDKTPLGELAPNIFLQPLPPSDFTSSSRIRTAMDGQRG